MRLAIACTSLLAGCSLAFVHGPDSKISRVASGEPPVHCTTSRLAPFGDLAIGIPTALIGSGYFLAAELGRSGFSAAGGGLSDSEATELKMIGGALFLTGAIFMAVAMSGLRTIRNCNSARDSALMADQFASRKPHMARQLTDEARIAANANDCPRVIQLAQRVIELDRETFDAVFSRDPIIMTCAPERPSAAPPGLTTEAP